jgi:hypothetical protein
MRFKASFGIRNDDLVKRFDLLGAQWSIDRDYAYDGWFEIHFFGFIFYFDFIN